MTEDILTLFDSGYLLVDISQVVEIAYGHTGAGTFFCGWGGAVVHQLLTAAANTGYRIVLFIAKLSRRSRLIVFDIQVQVDSGHLKYLAGVASGTVEFDFVLRLTMGSGIYLYCHTVGGGVFAGGGNIDHQLGCCRRLFSVCLDLDSVHVAGVIRALINLIRVCCLKHNLLSQLLALLLINRRVAFGFEQSGYFFIGIVDIAVGDTIPFFSRFEGLHVFFEVFEFFGLIAKFSLCFFKQFFLGVALFRLGRWSCFRRWFYLFGNFSGNNYLLIRIDKIGIRYAVALHNLVDHIENFLIRRSGAGFFLQVRF